jgi:DNA-binding response OmpR family regulator
MNDVKILLVDDEEEFVTTLSERLQLRGFDVSVVMSGEAALVRVNVDPPDVMVLDLRMPGIDGVEVLRRVKRAHPRIQVIVMTGHGSDDDRSTCLELGAVDYHKKPIDIDRLLESMRSAGKRAKDYDMIQSA